MAEIKNNEKQMTEIQNEKKQLHSAWWVLLFGAIGGIWRAWFGGSFKHITRGVKYIVLITVVLGMYFVKDLLDWKNWRMYAVILTFMYFWAFSHGAWFKYWDNTDDAEDRHPLMVKFIQKIIGVENSRTFWGNAFGMMVRYTYTAIFVALAIPDALFLVAGPMVALCYVPAGYLHNTKIGEVLAGISVFSLLYFCI